MIDVERAIAQGDERAILSLREYDFIIAQYIAKMAVSMNGVDVITFTAGVGEKGPISRAGICSHLTFMGVEIDPVKNETKGEEIEISKEDSKVKVWVVPTDEELMMLSIYEHSLDTILINKQEQQSEIDTLTKEISTLINKRDELSEMNLRNDKSKGIVIPILP